jgi:hypothetical protein
MGYLTFFFFSLEELRLPHAATSPAKILGRRALRPRHDIDTLRSRMTFSRCLQRQEGGAIQTMAEKIVNNSEVTRCCCSQISPAVRSVSARERMLVAMLFR